jgi:hypothetical protein
MTLSVVCSRNPAFRLLRFDVAPKTFSQYRPIADSSSAANGPLFDHLVGADQNGIGDRQALLSGH